MQTTNSNKDSISVREPDRIGTLPIDFSCFPKTCQFGLMFDVDKFGIAYRNIVSHELLKEKLKHLYSVYTGKGYTIEFQQSVGRLTFKIIAPQSKWFKVVRYYPWAHWTIKYEELWGLREKYTNDTGTFNPLPNKKDEAGVRDGSYYSERARRAKEENDKGGE